MTKNKFNVSESSRIKFIADRYLPEGTILVPISDHLMQAVVNPIKFVQDKLNEMDYEEFCEFYDIEPQLLATMFLKRNFNRSYAKWFIENYLGGYIVRRRKSHSNK